MFEKKQWSKFENKLFYDGIGNYRHETADPLVISLMTKDERNAWRLARADKIILEWRNEREKIVYQFLREKNWDDFTQRDKEAVYATLIGKFMRDPFELLNPYEYYLLWYCHPMALWDNYVLHPLVCTFVIYTLLKRINDFGRPNSK